MQYYQQEYSYDNSTNLIDLAGKSQTVLANSNKLAGVAYDASGNQLEIANKKVTYNHQGQTLRVEWPFHTEYYTYASSGQRIKKVSETQDASGLTTQVDIVLYVGGTEYRSNYRGTNLTYDGQTVVDLGQEIAAQSSTAQNRVKSGHGQLAKITRDIQQEETTYVYSLLNHLDNNSGVLDAQSQFKSYQAYYPYGKTAGSQGNTNNKQLGFSGQELDGTDFNYYGYRYYNSSMGRWTRPDPLGMQGSGLNLYAMTGGNPVTFQDQRGLDFEKFKMLLMGLLKNRDFDENDENIVKIYRNIEKFICGYCEMLFIRPGDQIRYRNVFKFFPYLFFPDMHYLAYNTKGLNVMTDEAIYGEGFTVVHARENVDHKHPYNPKQNLYKVDTKYNLNTRKISLCPFKEKTVAIYQYYNNLRFETLEFKQKIRVRDICGNDHQYTRQDIEGILNNQERHREEKTIHLFDIGARHLEIIDAFGHFKYENLPVSSFNLLDEVLSKYPNTAMMQVLPVKLGKHHDVVKRKTRAVESNDKNKKKYSYQMKVQERQGNTVVSRLSQKRVQEIDLKTEMDPGKVLVVQRDPWVLLLDSENDHGNYDSNSDSSDSSDSEMKDDH